MKYLLLIICLVLISCGEAESDYSKKVGKIADQFIRKSRQEGFRVSSFGGGMIGDIQRLNIGFISLSQMNIEKARILIVNKEEEFLKMLNENLPVRPYLHVYPFPVNRFELGILFENIDGSIVSPPYIASVPVIFGKIFYRIDNIETDELDTIYSEPYEEAYRIVYGEDRKM